MDKPEKPGGEPEYSYSPPAEKLIFLDMLNNVLTTEQVRKLDPATRLDVINRAEAAAAKKKGGK